jgi:hypothetical protein
MDNTLYKEGTSRLPWKLGRLGEAEPIALELEAQDLGLS